MDAMTFRAPTGSRDPGAPRSGAPAGSSEHGLGGERTTLHIAKMGCPTEESLIRDKLATMPGIGAMEFNLVQRTLTLTHMPGRVADAIEAIRALGMDAQAQTAERPVATAQNTGATAWWPLVVAGVAATSAEIVHLFDAGNHWLEAGLAIVAILVVGLPIYRKGWIAVTNLNLNINALMSIAVTGAMLIGEFPEAAMVMFLFAVAEVIEARSLDRARNAIKGLMDLAPETVTVLAENGAWSDVAAAAVPIGARARVKPGERIALDGVVVAGRSSVDQSPITGESLPVDKAERDPVFAGTINQAGAFEYRVTATATQSTLARIIHAVEQAQGARAPTQRFVDRFARMYTPAVLVVAVLVAIVPPLLLDTPWQEAIYQALVLLVIACPCALVISTPVTIVSGLAAAARRGILVKGGVFLEEGRKLDLIALDKTGTLTHGKPAQTDMEAVASDDLAGARTIAASMAARSDHPVSQAVAKDAAASGLAFFPVDDFAAIPGRGVRGRIAGRAYHFGNHRLIEELKLCSSELEARLDRLERQGKTVVLLADESRVLALFAVADTLKATSRAAVADLHALGITTLMLSGDNPHTAQAIALQAGIDEARGNLLPEDKLAALEALISAGRKVGMVGDGINDAPALARADIGFAMGAAGTDTAIETADVALMDDDLRKIPSFVRLSRDTAVILKQNIAAALGIKAIFIVLTMLGEATMWMAVFADMGASLLVVFNGLRLLRSRA